MTISTSANKTIAFIAIEQHMTSEQAGINAQLLAEGYSRQHIVLAFIASCYGVAINHVRLLGRTQYAVKGLDATCALPVNIVRYLTPVVHHAIPAVAKVETRTPEETKVAVERATAPKGKGGKRTKVAKDAGTPTMVVEPVAE